MHEGNYNGVVLKSVIGNLVEYSVYLRNGLLTEDNMPLYEYHTVRPMNIGGEKNLFRQVTIFSNQPGIDGETISRYIEDGRLKPVTDDELGMVRDALFSKKRAMKHDDYRRIYDITDLRKS